MSRNKEEREAREKETKAKLVEVKAATSGKRVIGKARFAAGPDEGRALPPPQAQARAHRIQTFCLVPSLGGRVAG